MPRPDVSEERRGQILDAAASVFARVGVREARMDDIVAEADLSKGALYWYFKSKDELIAAYIERVFARGIDNLSAVLQVEQSFKQHLAVITHAFAEDIREVSRVRSVVLEYYAIAARDEKVRARVRDYIEKFIALLETMIVNAIARGECRPIDARKTAISLEAMFEGLTLLWFVGAGIDDIGAMVQHASQMMFDSLVIS